MCSYDNKASFTPSSETLRLNNSITIFTLKNFFNALRKIPNHYFFLNPSSLLLPTNHSLISLTQLEERWGHHVANRSIALVWR